MKNDRTAVSVIAMVLSGIVGAFAGALFNDMLGGATLFSLIAGIACIVDALTRKMQNNIAPSEAERYGGSFYIFIAA